MSFFPSYERDHRRDFHYLLVSADRGRFLQQQTRLPRDLLRHRMSQLRQCTHSSPSVNRFIYQAVHTTQDARSPPSSEDQLTMGSLWEDDPELLHATLSLLLPGAQDAEDDTSSSSSGDADYATRKRRSVNLSRERQKEELLELRRLKVELETQLTTIEKKHQQQLQVARPVGSDLDAARLWEATALRQFHSRKKAELVNRKLRLVLHEQESIAQELLHALQGIDNSRQLLSQWTFESFHVAQSNIPSENELLDRIAGVCGQSRVPFSVFKNVLRDNHQEVCVIRDSEDEVVLELHWRSSHPFTVDQLRSALWSFWQNPVVLEDDYSLIADASEKDGNMFSSVQITTSKDGLSGGIVGLGVRRQLNAGADEFLQVSTAHCISREQSPASELSCSSSLEDDSVIMARDQYLRIIPAHSAKDGDRPVVLSVVEQVIRARLRFPSGRPEQSRVLFLTRLLRTFMTEELRCALEAAERILICTPMKRARVTPIDSSALASKIR